MECGYPPFNWTQLDNSNGAVPIAGSKEFAGGYDVEIAKKLAEGMGRQLIIVKPNGTGSPRQYSRVLLMALLPVCLQWLTGD